MINNINAFNYANSISLGAGAFLAFPAIEMAVRTLGDLGELFKIKCYPESVIPPKSIIQEVDSLVDALVLAEVRIQQRKAEILSRLKSDAACAVICGLFAANLFTGSSIIGAVGFCYWAKKNCLNGNSGYSTRIIGLPLVVLSLPEVKSWIREKTILVAKKILNGIKAVSKGLLKIIHSVINVFGKILKAIIAPFKILIKGISKLGKFCLIPFKAIGKIAAAILHPLGKVLAGLGKILLKNPKLSLIVLGAAGIAVASLVGSATLMAVASSLYSHLPNLSSLTHVALTIGNFACSILLGVGKFAYDAAGPCASALLGVGKFAYSAVGPCASAALKVGKIGLDALSLAGTAVVFVAKPVAAVANFGITAISKVFSIFKSVLSVF